ncbi:MAG TPA: hypothetical protein VEH53_01415, partial [archaeon]|nr:hypothetical protein [archaeon]
ERCSQATVPDEPSLAIGTIDVREPDPGQTVASPALAAALQKSQKCLDDSSRVVEIGLDLLTALDPSCGRPRRGRRP